MNTLRIIKRDEFPDPADVARPGTVEDDNIHDFTRTRMPEVLADIQVGKTPVDELQQKVASLVQYFHGTRGMFARGGFDSLAKYDANQPSHSLQHLDFTMLDNAIRAVGGTPPENLLNTIDNYPQFRKFPPTLTYEGVCHTNPLLDDPRSFTTGEQGRSELYFYGFHAHIDNICASCIRDIQLAMLNIRSTEFSYGDQTLKTYQFLDATRDSVLPHIKSISANFKSMLNEFSEEHFADIRGFFSSNPRNGLAGPSGKFSSGMFAVDAHIAGGEPGMNQFLNGKLREKNLFPQTTVAEDNFAGQLDMDEAMEAVEAKQTLFDLCQEIDHPLAQESMAELLKEMANMRRLHIAIAAKFAPEAMNGAVGTGGEQNVKAYLNMPVQFYRDLHRKISQPADAV